MNKKISTKRRKKCNKNNKTPFELSWVKNFPVGYLRFRMMIIIIIGENLKKLRQQITLTHIRTHNTLVDLSLKVMCAEWKTLTIVITCLFTFLYFLNKRKGNFFLQCLLFIFSLNDFGALFRYYILYKVLQRKYFS